MNKQPKILLIDIETAPILGHVWSLWENNVGLNQIKSDWHVISWAAKWVGQKQVMYSDQRKAKNIANDKSLLLHLWHLLDEADVVVAHNGNSFDIKKLNARFIAHGFKPPSSYRHIDTLLLARKHFKFTSNKLEYLSENLAPNYKKHKHHKFPGFELWRECLNGNIQAWKEMEVYNKQDVLALEQVYNKLIPWDNSINYNVYTPDETPKCTCGSTSFIKYGFFFTNVGKYQRYKCTKCGSEAKDRKNLLSTQQRALLKTKTVR